MKLAPQPLRRNLRAKPAPPNLWTCAQRASIDSAIGTFRTLSKICRAVTVSRSKFFRYRSSVAKRHASKPFRMNTCESVSKQRTLTTFRINTYEKPGGEGGPAFRVSIVQPPVSSLQNHMRHVAPLSPVASVHCAYFLSPRGVYESVWQLGLTLPLYWRERRSAGWPIFWSTTRSKLT